MRLQNLHNGEHLLSGNIGHLVGRSPRLLNLIQDEKVHLRWPETETELLISVSVTEDKSLHLLNVCWSTQERWSLEDSYNLSSSNSHWYGGAEMYAQYWPIEKQNIGITPYTTCDIFEGPWGNVQERYWLTSKCLALTVDDEVPLWLGMNEDSNGLFVMRAQYKESIYSNFVDVTQVRPHLTYTFYVPSWRMSLKEFQLNMVKHYLGKPRGKPDSLMMTQPIWSTWATYKQNIDQNAVLHFAREILAHNFSSSQLQIDDKWETCYGDMAMDPVKFPDPVGMVKTLNSMGFRITLWIHPFANGDSVTAHDSSTVHYWVSKNKEHEPAMLSWWNGNKDEAVMLDTTNDASVSWFVDRLKIGLTRMGFTSFKFDAGETNWLPGPG